jgi:hypothetical protein
MVWYFVSIPENALSLGYCGAFATSALQNTRDGRFFSMPK